MGTWGIWNDGGMSGGMYGLEAKSQLWQSAHHRWQSVLHSLFPGGEIKKKVLADKCNTNYLQCLTKKTLMVCFSKAKHLIFTHLRIHVAQIVL